MDYTTVTLQEVKENAVLHYQKEFHQDNDGTVGIYVFSKLSIFFSTALIDSLQKGIDYISNLENGTAMFILQPYFWLEQLCIQIQSPVFLNESPHV